MKHWKGASVNKNILQQHQDLHLQSKETTYALLDLFLFYDALTNLFI